LQQEATMIVGVNRGGVALIVLMAMTAPFAVRGAAAAPPQTRVNSVAASEAAFVKRVNEYMALQKKLAAMLPKLPTDATPQQIDQHQRAMGELVAQARAGAKPGDLFTPDMQRVVHRLFAEVFTGKAGRHAKDYIHDEPHPVTPEINKRYPDTIPLATMPLRVLAELPKLPDDLEYRFVANHLILMDVQAHLILDYVLNAIPGESPARKGK
jgi:hypothetical protein